MSAERRCAYTADTTLPPPVRGRIVVVVVWRVLRGAGVILPQHWRGDAAPVKGGAPVSSD